MKGRRVLLSKGLHHFSHHTIFIPARNAKPRADSRKQGSESTGEMHTHIDICAVGPEWEKMNIPTSKRLSTRFRDLANKAVRSAEVVLTCV